MNDYQDQPGGGFSSVGGYDDIAGSQAEEQRRMQEDELNRQRMEQAANDAAAAAAQAETENLTRQPSSNAGSNNNHHSSSSRQSTTRTQKRKPASAKSPPPATASEINTGFAILGFVLAGIWGMGLLEGDGRWFSGLVVGLIGAHVAGYYHKVLIAAGLVGGCWWILYHYDASSSMHATSTDAVAATTSHETISKPSIPIASTIKTPVKAFAETTVAQTPEQEVAARFPYPAKPSLLLRPHQNFTTDPTRMREFQDMMFDYESKTGKSFLTDHRSMKPVSLVRYDYVSRYGDGELLEGQLPIPELSAIEGVWDYSGPQLWELDLKATVDQHFLFRTKSPDGRVREGVFRTYSGDGLCYHPTSRPLSKDGRQHENFQTPVQGGEVWREFVRSVYTAKTDAELLSLDPINLAIAQTHRNTAKQKANHEAQLQLVDRQRAATLPLVQAAWRMHSTQPKR